MCRSQTSTRYKCVRKHRSTQRFASLKYANVILEIFAYRWLQTPLTQNNNNNNNNNKKKKKKKKKKIVE